MSELWTAIQNWLPEISLGGFDIPWPAVGVGGVLSGIGIIWIAIQVWNNLMTLLFPSASAKGQKKTHDDLALLSAEIKKLQEQVAKSTAPETPGETAEPEIAKDRDEAVERIFKQGSASEIAALNEIAQGDVKGGIRDLKQQIGAIQSEADRLTAQKWRDIGALAYDREPAEALNAYREAAKLDTSDTWALIYLGRLERSHGDGLEAAANVIDTALKSVTDERDKSVLFNELGNMRRAQGDLSGALASYEAGLAIATRLADQDSGNSGWQRDLSVSHEKIGDVRRAQGDLSGALESYEASLAIRERLADQDSGNSEWQADLAASHGKLGQLRFTMNEPEAALALFRKGRAIVAPLAQASGHVLWQGYLEIFDADIARAEAAIG